MMKAIVALALMATWSEWALAKPPDITTIYPPKRPDELIRSPYSASLRRQITVLTSDIGQEEIKLKCPKRHFAMSINFKKGYTRGFWNGTEWFDVVFEFECRPFRDDDKV